MMLSPKAALFIATAIADAGSAWIRDAVGKLGPDPWMRELSPRAVEIALKALSESEAAMRERLEYPEIGEDEEADLLNDLGFVVAIQSELRQELASS